MQTSATDQSQCHRECQHKKRFVPERRPRTVFACPPHARMDMAPGRCEKGFSHERFMFTGWKPVPQAELGD